MPPKVRDLIAELLRAGFVDRGGKGSHRNFVHPNLAQPITISGNPGDRGIGVRFDFAGERADMGRSRWPRIRT